MSQTLNDPLSNLQRELLNTLENPQSEAEIVRVIRVFLITGEQIQALAQAGLSIEDLLNGRFNAEQEPLVRSIFTRWNLALGKENFKI